MPAMLRIVTADGVPIEAITLRKTWHPSGRSEELAYRTAAGLCLIPWLGTEKRLRIRVSTATTGAVEVEVRRDRPDAGRVQDLVLTSAISALEQHALIDLSLDVPLPLALDAAE